MFNLFQCSVAFYLEKVILFWFAKEMTGVYMKFAKEMTGFYMKYNTGLKLVDEDLSPTNIKNSAFLTNRLTASPTKWSNTICRLLCLIWYHLNNFGNMKNTQGGVLLLVKLQAEACDFTKRTLLYVFFSRCLNRTNGTKSCKASPIYFAQIIVRKNACYWQKRPIANTQPKLNINTQLILNVHYACFVRSV